MRLRKACLLAFGFLLVGCTPDEIMQYRQVTDSYQEFMSSDELYRLRLCESTDNYSAVDPSGTFRGAYQFNQSTWNAVASRHFTFLVGVDPAVADPWWQDVMAKALFSERGRAPWPVCGKRI